MTTPLPPDFEDRHTLALALCQHLGINPQHVLLGSMQIELGPDARHRITWTGHAALDLDDLTRLLLRANHPNDNPDHNPDPDDCTHPLKLGDAAGVYRCLNCGHGLAAQDL